jgi:hypothetical protein
MMMHLTMLIILLANLFGDILFLRLSSQQKHRFRKRLCNSKHYPQNPAIDSREFHPLIKLIEGMRVSLTSVLYNGTNLAQQR